jgi:hypothetical protein
MTLIIIFLMSLLSTYSVLTLIAASLNTKIKDIFDSTNELYIMYQTFMVIMMTLVFFIIYCAINNTFLYFKI